VKKRATAGNKRRWKGSREKGRAEELRGGNGENRGNGDI